MVETFPLICMKYVNAKLLLRFYFIKGIARGLLSPICQPVWISCSRTGDVSSMFWLDQRTL